MDVNVVRIVVCVLCDVCVCCDVCSKSSTMYIILEY